jgi:hypothetical protein
MEILVNVPLLIFVEVALIVASVAVGVILGERKERKGWNSLIQKGILPKPQGEK